MSVNENKAVVREFVKKVLMGLDVGMVDKLCASNYVNRSMGNVDLAGFKALLSAIKSAKATMDIEIEDMVGEGDSVVIRGKVNVTQGTGKRNTARIITYYRLTNGKIAEDEPVSNPDLSQILGNIAPQKTIQQG
jgi:predicted SnoaL-like aldol condensation-catalyzing enzyme